MTPTDSPFPGDLGTPAGFGRRGRFETREARGSRRLSGTNARHRPGSDLIVRYAAADGTRAWRPLLIV